MFRSLSAVAREITGTRWNGRLFFGLKKGNEARWSTWLMSPQATPLVRKLIRCAIYTRKSHEEGLEQEFNSLDAQREAAEAYIESQRMQGWRALPDPYDDGGFSGSNMERPGLQRLLADVDAGKVDVIVVYKIDRLSRSLLDFMKMIERFNEKGISFVSVTQHFNTTGPTGRMFLSILITFAQYEREVIAERIRDKVAAAKRRGKYCGGPAILGYDVDRKRKKLLVNLAEAPRVQHIFRRFTQLASAKSLAAELNEQGYRTKSWTTKKGKHRPGSPWNTGPTSTGCWATASTGARWSTRGRSIPASMRPSSPRDCGRESRRFSRRTPGPSRRKPERRSSHRSRGWSAAATVTARWV